MKIFKCNLCNQKSHGYGNNGAPLVNGKVCDSCNITVINERIKRSVNAGDLKGEDDE